MGCTWARHGDLESYSLLTDELPTRNPRTTHEVTTGNIWAIILGGVWATRWLPTDHLWANDDPTNDSPWATQGLPVGYKWDTHETPMGYPWPDRWQPTGNPRPTRGQPTV